MSRRTHMLKAAGFLVTGILVGSLVAEPVGAHFRQNTRHLGRHAWAQVIKKQTRKKFYTKRRLDTGRAPKCRGISKADEMRKVGGVCIDRFENSIWTKRRGGRLIPNSEGLPCADNGQDCKGKIFARSVKGVEPRNNITWFQAQAALTNVGKRLPTNAEWQAAAQGTPDPGTDDGSTDCNTTEAGDDPVPTGSRSTCVSVFGAFDMVGNLGEWVADWDEDAAGCQSWSPSFGQDLSCMGRGEGDLDTHLPGALLRGGSYNIGSGAGVFAVIGTARPSASFPQNGFRGAR